MKMICKRKEEKVEEEGEAGVSKKGVVDRGRRTRPEESSESIPYITY